MTTLITAAKETKFLGTTSPLLTLFSVGKTETASFPAELCSKCSHFRI